GETHVASDLYVALEPPGQKATLTENANVATTNAAHADSIQCLPQHSHASCIVRSHHSRVIFGQAVATDTIVLVACADHACSVGTCMNPESPFSSSASVVSVTPDFVDPCDAGVFLHRRDANSPTHCFALAPDTRCACTSTIPSYAIAVIIDACHSAN